MTADIAPVPQRLADPHGLEALQVKSARACFLVGASGREYLDLTSGWNVANLGWSNPEVLERVLGQMKTLALAPAWCLHEPVIELGETLGSLLDRDLALLRAATGTQAVEFALRVARRATGRYAVVSVSECYHGSTLASLAASGIRYLQERDPALLPWHRSLPLPASGTAQDEAIRSVIQAEPLPAAVLIEPVLTNPGVFDGGRAYYGSIVAAARSCGALVIVDEVGTGLGRTGSLFGFQRQGLRPDIFVLGKSLGGGVTPMAATVCDGSLRQYVQGLAFDSTFAGTPAGCAAALAMLDILTHSEVLERSNDMARQAMRSLRARLSGHSALREVRGAGLLIGIEFERPTRPEQAKFAEGVVRALLQRGIFAACSRYSYSLLLMPPLNIEPADFSRALDEVVDCIDRVARLTEH